MKIKNFDFEGPLFSNGEYKSAKVFKVKTYLSLFALDASKLIILIKFSYFLALFILLNAQSETLILINMLFLHGDYMYICYMCTEVKIKIDYILFYIYSYISISISINYNSPVFVKCMLYVFREREYTNKYMHYYLYPTIY